MSAKGRRPKGTGTLPKKRQNAPAPRPGRKTVKGGAGRGLGSKHDATRAQGQRTSATRKAGPRKTKKGTTTRSGDK